MKIDLINTHIKTHSLRKKDEEFYPKSKNSLFESESKRLGNRKHVQKICREADPSNEFSGSRFDRFSQFETTDLRRYFQ